MNLLTLFRLRKQLPKMTVGARAALLTAVTGVLFALFLLWVSYNSITSGMNAIWSWFLGALFGAVVIIVLHAHMDYCTLRRAQLQEVLAQRRTKGKIIDV